MRKLIFIFVLSTNFLSSQEILRIDNSISSISYSGTHFLHNWDATNDNISGLIELNDNQISKIGVLAKVADFKSGNSSLDSNSFRVLDAIFTTRDPREFEAPCISHRGLPRCDLLLSLLRPTTPTTRLRGWGFPRASLM